MLVKTFGAAVQGINATIVTIEVNVSQGIRFMIVGLPDNAVRESHERVVSALKYNGYDLPRKQVIVNMAPADIRKEGSAYDLPLAIGIMAASEKIPAEELDKYVIMGELSLDGRVRPVRGILPAVLAAKREGWPVVVVPVGNLAEASLVDGIDVRGVRTLGELRNWLSGSARLSERVAMTARRGPPCC